MQGPIFGHVIESVRPGDEFFRIGIGINPRQAAATVERTFADVGGGVADGDARQAEAFIVFVYHFISINYVLNGRKVKP